MPAFTDYQIAAGHNNAAGLVKIGLIVPSSNIAFTEPVARPNWNPGIQRIRLDTISYSAGYRSQVWSMGFLTYAQYDYLLSTYCGGGQSGKVTVRTRYRTTSYANYNATLSVPIPDELQNNGQGYQQVPLTLKKLIAI